MKPPPRERRTAYVYEMEDTSRFSLLLQKKKRSHRKARKSASSQMGGSSPPAAAGAGVTSSKGRKKRVTIAHPAHTTSSSSAMVDNPKRRNNNKSRRSTMSLDGMLRRKWKSMSTREREIERDEIVSRRRGMIGRACRTYGMPLRSRAFALCGFSETKSTEVKNEGKEEEEACGGCFAYHHSDSTPRCKWQVLTPFPFVNRHHLAMFKRNGTTCMTAAAAVAPNAEEVGNTVVCTAQQRERDGIEALRSLRRDEMPKNVRDALVFGDAADVGDSDDETDVLFVNMYEPPTSTLNHATAVTSALPFAITLQQPDDMRFTAGRTANEDKLEEVELQTDTTIDDNCDDEDLQQSEEEMVSGSTIVHDRCRCSGGHSSQLLSHQQTPSAVWIDLPLGTSEAVEGGYQSFLSRVMRTVALKVLDQNSSSSASQGHMMKDGGAAEENVQEEYAQQNDSNLTDSRRYLWLHKQHERNKKRVNDDDEQMRERHMVEVDLYRWTLHDGYHHEDVRPIRRVPIGAISC